MMITNVNQIRRVVTAERPDGASYVAADGRPARLLGSYSLMWVTQNGQPALPLRDPSGDLTKGAERMFPKPGETHFWATLVAPHSEVPSNNPAWALRDDTRGRGPNWHATRSVDHVIIMQGEITLELDDQAVTLKAGDVAVQAGASHKWVNNGDEPCLMYSVILGAADDR